MLHYTLAREGNFYKGNLHTHSTISDGELTPEQLKALYRSHGYSFLAITDHNTYFARTDMNEPDFLVVPGIEVDCTCAPRNSIDHVVGIGHPDRTRLAHGQKVTHLLRSSAQALVDFLVENGNEAIYAHPFWSYKDIGELLSLRGHLGMEIINYSCEQEWKAGISEFYYEHAWNAGHNLFCFGSDDAHGHVPDFCGGYITVKCSELSYDALFAALRAGSFTASYARCGEEAPTITDFVVEDGVARLTCSPCAHVCLNVDRCHYHPTFAQDGAPVTCAEYVLPEGATSVKAICVDEKRNITWSQPISLCPAQKEL